MKPIAINRQTLFATLVLLSTTVQLSHGFAGGPNIDRFICDGVDTYIGVQLLCDYSTAYIQRQYQGYDMETIDGFQLGSVMFTGSAEAVARTIEVVTGTVQAVSSVVSREDGGKASKDAKGKDGATSAAGSIPAGKTGKRGDVGDGGDEEETEGENTDGETGGDDNGSSTSAPSAGGSKRKTRTLLRGVKH